MVPGAAIVAGMPAVAEAAVAAGIFFEANEAAGVDAPHRSSWAEFVHDSFTSGYLGIGQAWGDYDNDGWVDLFLAGGQSPSTLYRNDGDGTFSIPEQSAGVALAAAWTGGAVWADYDNDGWRDLYVLTHGPNVLFRNEAGAGFLDVTATAGVGDTGKGSTAAWGDYDGDGSTGSVGLLFPHANVLYRNRGYGNYIEATPPSWHERPKPSMGAAYADYDRDGLVDFVVGNFDVGFTLYRNAGLAADGSHWLTVRLEGRPPVNRDAIGARVFVTPGDGRPRMQEVKSGSSLGAGNDTALHFGLGAASTATVRVVWPDGTEEAFGELAVDREWHLVYGGG